ncbi:MAG: hypothetical protein HY681_11545 [Chloroflexi bacterium]|nr:hypothetical protein [Chloroflexota bacterium]
MQQTPEGPSLEDQFQIYAKELGELYIAEQRRRAELAEEKLVLEHRVKELEALNHMFQTHLARRIALEEALQDVVEKLHQAAEGPLSGMRVEIERIAEEASLRLLEESLGESGPTHAV